MSTLQGLKERLERTCTVKKLRMPQDGHYALSYSMKGNEAWLLIRHLEDYAKVIGTGEIAKICYKHFKHGPDQVGGNERVFIWRRNYQASDVD